MGQNPRRKTRTTNFYSGGANETEMIINITMTIIGLALMSVGVRGLLSKSDETKTSLHPWSGYQKFEEWCVESGGEYTQKEGWVCVMPTSSAIIKSNESMVQ